MSSKKTIPNPNKLSSLEADFVSETKHPAYLLKLKNLKPKYKGRMISMSDDFYEELNDFLKKHPTEGNRSSFIVRIIAEYIRNKKEN